MSELPVLTKRLSAGFAALAGITWLLLIFGSTVRVHGAGLSCPDWPLCFGEVIPQLNFQVFLEWGHRVLAGSISIGGLALGAVLLRRSELRSRYWGHLAALAVVLALQIVLGGLTVLKLLAYWSVTLHLLFGNAFMVLLIVLARRLSGAPGAPASAPSRALLGVAVAFAAALALQMALGGLVSSNYAGLVCTEWPTCNGGVWFPTFTGIVGLQLMHRLGAYAVAGLGLALGVLTGRSRGSMPVYVLLALVVLQVVLGIANVLAAMPVELAIAHAATAHAIVAATSVVLPGLFLRNRS